MATVEFVSDEQYRVQQLEKRVLQLAGDMRAIRYELERISSGHLESITIPLYADDWPENPVGKGYARVTVQKS